MLAGGLEWFGLTDGVWDPQGGLANIAPAASRSSNCMIHLFISLNLINVCSLQPKILWAGNPMLGSHAGSHLNSDMLRWHHLGITERPSHPLRDIRRHLPARNSRCQSHSTAICSKLWVRRTQNVPRGCFWYHPPPRFLGEHLEKQAGTYSQQSIGRGIKTCSLYTTSRALENSTTTVQNNFPILLYPVLYPQNTWYRKLLKLLLRPPRLRGWSGAGPDQGSRCIVVTFLESRLTNPFHETLSKWQFIYWTYAFI